MPQSLPEMLLLGRRGPQRGRLPEQPPKRTKRRSAVALSGVPLFSGLSKKHLNHLASSADEVSFARGESIVREGELGETLFVILEGQVKVVMKGKKIARLLPGSFFGELSALDGGPRIASVVAETPVKALRVFHRTMMELLASEPALTIKMLEDIARRIRGLEPPLNG